jgi:phosphohistidine swiveling domain-containing protein
LVITTQVEAEEVDVVQGISQQADLVVSVEAAVASAAAVVDLEEAVPQEVGNGFIK